MSAAASRVLAIASTLAAGALFGFGLAWSTMIRPDIVLGFLRFQDFGLMLVMAGAAGVTLLAYQFGPRLWRHPLAGGRFESRVSRWDRPTFIGSAIFGIGWGLCGVCPGPAIAGLGAGQFDLLWAGLGMLLGALVQGWGPRPSVADAPEG
jgi:uncharacterized membrane protein YedE/YeeE